MFKKKMSIFLVLILVVSLMVACGGDADKPAGDAGDTDKPAAKDVYISIATGGTAGTYFPLGGAIAKILFL